MVPWLWKRPRLYSDRLVEWHFWIATTGILLYIAAMWVSGIMEGLMWRKYTPEGFLAYSFVQTVSAKHVSNMVRALGGAMYLTGTLIMVYNVWRTIAGHVRQDETGAVLVQPSASGPASAGLAAAQ
jgi:cytochrome c oxidase cbb3-type subunit 1